MRHRFFLDQGRIGADKAYLEPEEAKHAVRVLRLLPGAEIEALDGRCILRAVLLEPDEGGQPVRLAGVLPDHEPGLRVTLYQGMAKGDKMDLVVQKATEIGAAAVVPVRMARCVAKPDDKATQKAQARWQRIAREAAKQCGRAVTPEIGEPLGIKQLAGLCGGQPLLIPWEEAADGSLTQALGVQQDGKVGILIGPEGGITLEEIELLVAAGAKTVTLGRRILRTETAGLCALTLLLGRSGILE